MRTPAGFVPIVLALAAIILVSAACARGQNPRERGPIAIERCQTIDQPGSYKLVNNLHASGDCLEIRAQGVTIDLGGFAITGDRTTTEIKGKKTQTVNVPQARTLAAKRGHAKFA